MLVIVCWVGFVAGFSIRMIEVALSLPPIGCKYGLHKVINAIPCDQVERK